MKQKYPREVSPNRAWKRTAVAAAVSLAIHQSIQAQEAQQDPRPQPIGTSDSLEEVVVTATRRAESIQKVPFNISAIDGAQIAEKGLTGLTDLLRQTPGVFSPDQGRGVASEIVARGLSVGGTSEPGFANNDVGGVVSTYLGEIPTFVDLRLTDIERVEVLLGPQGTLYGAGTLGGAVRYLPRKPRLDTSELALRSDTYTYSESDGVGADAGFTLNVPISEQLAFRASVDYLRDPGFVDYNFVVREQGVSDPQPDFSDPADVAANLRRVKDANKDRTLSGRAALRWKPGDALEAILTVYFQDQDVDAGAVNNLASFGTGRYESAGRMLEYTNRRNRIGSLEVTADLGFAELTSASGYTDYDGAVQNDVTDLEMALGYNYVLFPAFVYPSPWTTRQSRFSQEVRLVSKNEGQLSWIAGVFFDRRYTFTDSPEFSPGLSQYWVENWGGLQLRPDDMTLANFNKVHQKEKAVFGELSYKLTEAWKIIGGARWYDYKQTTVQGFDFPLYYTVWYDRAPDSIVWDTDEFGANADGALLKFSTSYDFTQDLMGYFTRSEGYRIGSSNAYAPCSSGAKVCVSPGEEQYLPDTTVNYELGLRSQWLDHRLTVNGSVFYVDWKDPQLRGTTLVGGGGITTNGKGARTRGVDLSINAAVTSRLKIGGNYSFTDAELTADAPKLVRTIYPIGDPLRDPNNPFKGVRADGLAGDRLPHSPQHQGTAYLSYKQPLAGERNLNFNYGITANSSVLTTVGGRGDGEKLGGYALHSASAVLESNRWTLTLYADNLFNKFAKTGVIANRNYIQAVDRTTLPPPGNEEIVMLPEPLTLRRYMTSFVTPRQIGLRFTYDLGM
jgi:outer membrane receptor protein involved in Fe transport